MSIISWVKRLGAVDIPPAEYSQHGGKQDVMNFLDTLLAEADAHPEASVVEAPYTAPERWRAVNALKATHALATGTKLELKQKPSPSIPLGVSEPSQTALTIRLRATSPEELREIICTMKAGLAVAGHDPYGDAKEVSVPGR